MSRRKHPECLRLARTVCVRSPVCVCVGYNEMASNIFCMRCSCSLVYMFKSIGRHFILFFFNRLRVFSRALPFTRCLTDTGSRLFAHLYIVWLIRLAIAQHASKILKWDDGKDIMNQQEQNLNVPQSVINVETREEQRTADCRSPNCEQHEHEQSTFYLYICMCVCLSLSICLSVCVQVWCCMPLGWLLLGLFFTFAHRERLIYVRFGVCVHVFFLSFPHYVGK